MKKRYFLILFFTAILQAQIVSIPNTTFKVKLITLGLDTNHDEEIQVSEALAVTSLNLNNANITSLTGIEAFTNLTTLRCGGNPVGELHVENLIQLTELYVSACNLTSIDVTNLVNLHTFYCNDNNIASIDLSHQVNMVQMACSTNPLTTIDLSMMPQLQTLNVGRTNLSYLDLSHNPNLCLVACDQSPLLTRINMKDGSVSCLDSKLFFGNPNLINVCVDQGEALAMQNYFITHNMPNVNVNTYCTFTPGGDFNTISGTVAYDFDNNGCDGNDFHQSLIKVKMTDGIAESNVFTNESGAYINYMGTGNLTITPALENPDWFLSTPSSASVNFANSNNNLAVKDFCLTANGFHPDIEVVVLPLGNARPGFDAAYKITFKNKGNYTYSEGIVSLTFDDLVLDYLTASENPLTQSGGQLSWLFQDLHPFESQSIEVSFNLNGPMEIPAVNNGDILHFTVASFPSEVDETPLDNTFTFNQTVEGSFDPNDKTCLEGNVVSADQIGKYLHYSINFENTGTAAAEKIVIRDLIDTSKFDLGSLQVLSTSHPAATKISGSKVEFFFENINLAPAAHGNLVFKIKTKSDLPIGTTVSNQASIYFDYNFPVNTNTTTTTFALLANADFNQDTSVILSPNPATDRIFISADSILKSIEIYDVQGRALNIDFVNQANTTLEVSRYPKGVYFLKVTTEKGGFVGKVIKE